MGDWRRPHEGGSFSLHEKGVAYFDGRRRRFVRWQEIDRFEWNGRTLLIEPIGTVSGRSADRFGFDVPDERRSEVETIVASHLQG